MGTLVMLAPVEVGKAESDQPQCREIRQRTATITSDRRPTLTTGSPLPEGLDLGLATVYRVLTQFDAEIEKRQTRIARERGFEISEHALYLYAECTRVKCPHRKPGGHD